MSPLDAPVVARPPRRRDEPASGSTDPATRRAAAALASSAGVPERSRPSPGRAAAAAALASSAGVPERSRPSPDRAAAAGSVGSSAGVPERSRPSPDRAAAAGLLVSSSPYLHGSAAPKPDVAPDGGVEEGSLRHLRVVGPKERTPAERRRRAQVVMVVSVVIGLGIALSLVYLHVVLAQRQFRLDGLDSQVQSEQTQYQKLRLEVAELGAPVNIISTAEGTLGMVQPATITYLPADAAGVTGGAAAGARGAGAPPASRSDKDGIPAPAGDADWPVIKSQLAGSP